MKPKHEIPMDNDLVDASPADQPVVPHAQAPGVKKAYTMRDDDEGNCVVVFATNSAEARRMGTHELDMDIEEVDSCVRAPEFDDYAGSGKVPPLVAIAHGWWFECSHCGHQVDEDAEGPGGEELHPVADGQRIYCNSEHLMAEWCERRTHEDRMNAVVEACALTFYDWPIFDLRGHEHYNSGGRDTVVCCDFDFPGRKGIRARWNLGNELVYISECDRDAWQATKDAMQLKGGLP